MSIGTNTGASSAHFALAEPTNRLVTPVNSTISMSRTGVGSAICSNPFAPWTATIRPRFDQLNMATKWAAANARTR